MSRRSPYIVGPLYDWAFFLLPPVVAMWAGFMISGSQFSDHAFSLWGQETTLAALCLGTVVHAHLVAVVFRSHINRDVFRLHPARFAVVPVVVWLAIVSSSWLAVTATVVATFWDVWHSGAQTFGFARIYDRNAGAPPELARSLDKWMNQLLYAGPILAGATLMDHVHAFDEYDEVGSAFLTSIPARVEGAAGYVAWCVFGAGALFVAYYILAHLRMHRAGHPISPLKLFIVSSTGLCSVFAWGFNSWGEAFFIMNLFHAIQYLALVWAMEHGRMMKVMGVDSLRRGRLAAAVLFLAAVGGYGFVAQAVSGDIETLWALTITVSLMHFWYDGFVWSVRRQQV